MQKKIFRVMTLTSTLVLIVFAVIIGRISYISNKNASQNELKSVAKIIAQQDLEMEQIQQIKLYRSIRLLYCKTPDSIRRIRLIQFHLWEWQMLMSGLK